MNTLNKLSPVCMLLAFQGEKCLRGREREREKKERGTRVWSAFEILKYYLKSQVYVPVKVTCNVFFRVLYFYWLRLLRKLSL